MIQLFKDGKLVDYGTKQNVGFYVKLGYDVKVLNTDETEDWHCMKKIEGIWKNLPMVLKKRIHFVINNQKLRWTERYRALIRIIHSIMKRVKGFHVCSALNRRKQSLIDKLMSILKALFLPHKEVSV